MKTLEELVKELGLKPDMNELENGRTGNFVILFDDNEYTTTNSKTIIIMAKQYGYEVIEVKPE